MVSLPAVCSELVANKLNEGNLATPQLGVTTVCELGGHLVAVGLNQGQPLAFTAWGERIAFPLRDTREAIPENLRPLQSELDAFVDEWLKAELLAPLRVEIGLSGCEYFFDQSGEIFWALSLAWPHLSPRTQGEVREFLAALWEEFPPYDGRCFLPVDRGARREGYVLPKLPSRRDARERLPHPFANMYGIWAYAHYLDEWPRVREKYGELRGCWQSFKKSKQTWSAQEKMEHEELFANAYLGAMLGLMRIGKYLNDTKTQAELASEADKLAQWTLERFRRNTEEPMLPPFANVNEFDRWRAEGMGGFFWQQTPHKAKPVQFQGLVPEVGSWLRANAPDAARKYLDFVDRSLPGWYLMAEERQFHFGENYIDFPDFSLSIFQAKAYLGGSQPEQLAEWVDIPFCPGDAYFVEKLAILLHVAANQSRLK